MSGEGHGALGRVLEEFDVGRLGGISVVDGGGS